MCQSPRSIGKLTEPRSLGELGSETGNPPAAVLQVSDLEGTLPAALTVGHRREPRPQPGLAIGGTTVRRGGSCELCSDISGRIGGDEEGLKWI